MRYPTFEIGPENIHLRPSLIRNIPHFVFYNSRFVGVFMGAQRSFS